MTGPPVRVSIDASMLAWPSGGSTRYTRELVDRLAEDPRLRLTLLFNARTAPVTPVAARVVSRRVKGAILWRQGVVLPHLLRTRPDVFWSPWVASPVLTPVPLVLSVHDLAAVRWPDIKPRLETVAFRTLGRAYAQRAARVLALTPSGAEDLHRIWRIPTERIAVVPAGVDSDRFAPGDRGAAQARLTRDHGLAPGFALAVGTVEERKGYALLAEMLETGLLGEDALPGGLVLAGRVPAAAGPLVTRLRATGRCAVLGQVDEDELVALYRAAEVLLCPSRLEGFGLSAVEAMACGTPAVVADGPGALAEVSGPGGLAVPRDPAAWAAAVRRVLADRPTWAARGRALAERYTWQAAAEAAATVLLEVGRSTGGHAPGRHATGGQP